MITVVTYYELPHCSTCQKARQFLQDAGVTIHHSVNVKEQSVDKTTLKQLADALGGVDALFSKRALKYRAMGLHERTLSEDEMLDLMVQEYTFIKRPVMVFKDGPVMAGFSQKQLGALLKQLSA